MNGYEYIVVKRLRYVKDYRFKPEEIISHDLASYIALLAKKLSVQAGVHDVILSRWTGFKHNDRLLFEHDSILINGALYEVVWNDAKKRLVLRSKLDEWELEDLHQHGTNYELQIL